VPKIGPFAKTKMIDTSEEVEKLFEDSFKEITNQYSKALGKLKNSNTVDFANVDLDTGKKTHEGEYGISDEAYYDYLRKLKRQDFADMYVALKKHLIKFFDGAEKNGSTLSERKQEKVKEIIAQLRTIPVESVKN
jgi:hypothetical protein